MIEISTTTTIVTAIVGSAVGIIGILGLMMGLLFRSMNIQFTHTNRRIDDTRSELSKRIDDTRSELSKRIDDTRSELSNRLQRVETRVDEIGRDIGELRDRTGKLEGTLSTFMQNQGKVEAA